MDEKIVSIEQALRLALQEAAKGAAHVSPNPMVGCVISDETGRVIATGYHAQSGQAHAEVDALRKLKPEQLKNATVYVTLEPCAHEGRTPSCAKTLAKFPIKKVIYGLQDPNPLVCGKGAEILMQAGIEVIEYQGPLKDELEEICEVFLKNIRHKKVFVAAKVASSLDGQIALKSGESRWITGAKSREKVHALRANYDSILVGRNTILVDDPRLDVRHPQIQKENWLIILDPSGSLLKEIFAGQAFRFLSAHSKEKILFAVRKTQNEIPFRQIEFDGLKSLIQKLWDLGIRSVFIEGGARTYSSFLQEGLVDRLHLFMAPSIIGAGNGLSWTRELLTSQLDKKLLLSKAKTEKLGADLYISGIFSSSYLSSQSKV